MVIIVWRHQSDKSSQGEINFVFTEDKESKLNSCTLFLILYVFYIIWFILDRKTFLLSNISLQKLELTVRLPTFKLSQKFFLFTIYGTEGILTITFIILLLSHNMYVLTNSRQSIIVCPVATFWPSYLCTVFLTFCVLPRYLSLVFPSTVTRKRHEFGTF